MDISRRPFRGRGKTRGRRVFADRAPFCGSEDQSSWIADDFCARCGAATQHGKLYCSNQCRNEDLTSGSLAGNDLRGGNIHSDSFGKLRYPMTLSPHLTSSTVNTVATKKKFPSVNFGQEESASSSSSESEPSDINLVRGRKSPGSISSDPSDLVETDFTSPSPWRTGIDPSEGSDDISDLDESELQLPPSVMYPRWPGSHASASKPIKMQSGSCTPKARRSWTSPAFFPHLTPESQSCKAPISFSRLPCSTNLPPHTSCHKISTPQFAQHSARKGGNDCYPQDENAQHRRSSPASRFFSSAKPSFVSIRPLSHDYTKSDSTLAGLDHSVPKVSLEVLSRQSTNTPAVKSPCESETQNSPCMEAMDSCDEDEVPVRGRSRIRAGQACRPSVRSSSRTSSEPLLFLHLGTRSRSTYGARAK